MTTPGGVPNLPQGALTLDTLASKVQDMSGTAMKARAVERFPSIFDTSTGLSAASDITPFGILTSIWAGVNSLVANADPADVQGPEDLPALVLDFIEGLPFVGPLVGLLDAILGTYDGDDTTLLAIQAIFAPIRAIVEAITGGSGDLTDVSDFFNGLVPLDELVGAITGTPGGFGDLTPFFAGLTNGLFGQIDVSRIGQVSLSSIANVQPNLVAAAGSFPSAASIAPNSVWSYDPTVSATADGTGSAKTTANGTARVLRTTKIGCAPGDPITGSIQAKWAGLSYTGSNPLNLTVKYFLGDVEVSTVTLASQATPAASGGFVTMSGNTTVPAGVDGYYLRFAVEATATAGTVWIDDGNTTKTGLLQMDWTENLQQRWEQIAALFGIVDTDLDGDVDISDVWTTVFQLIFNPLGALIPGLLDPTVVGGHGGLDTLPATLAAFLDNFWPGGSGRSLADLLNISTDVANTAAASADIGNANATVLAFRGGQPTWKGMDQTGQVTFPVIMLNGATVNTFAVTRTTATIGFIPIDKAATIGSIYWYGAGLASITAAHLTFYKMDAATGDVTKVIETGDVSGFMTAGSTPVQANYDLAAGEKFDVLPGDVVAVELKVVGTGTHTVAGLQMNTPASTKFPTRHGAARNSNTGDTGGVSPATIAHGSVGYVANVPWFEIGIADGDVAPPVYAPRSFPFTASDAFTVPAWAVYLDIICQGGGQGGGDAVPFASNGTGGNNGNWGTATLQRGVDIPLSTAILTVTVGAGGIRTSASGSGGNNGGNSSVSGTGMTTVTGTGGSGGNPFSSQGAGDDDRTYNGVLYAQGNSTPNAGGSTPGNAPGGGGQGGAYPVGAAGNGARGQVWIVARTS